MLKRKNYKKLLITSFSAGIVPISMIATTVNNVNNSDNNFQSKTTENISDEKRDNIETSEKFINELNSNQELSFDIKKSDQLNETGGLSHQNDMDTHQYVRNVRQKMVNKGPWYFTLPAPKPTSYVVHKYKSSVHLRDMSFIKKEARIHQFNKYVNDVQDLVVAWDNIYVEVNLDFQLPENIERNTHEIAFNTFLWDVPLMDGMVIQMQDKAIAFNKEFASLGGNDDYRGRRVDADYYFEFPLTIYPNLIEDGFFNTYIDVESLSIIVHDPILRFQNKDLEQGKFTLDPILIPTGQDIILSNNRIEAEKWFKKHLVIKNYKGDPIIFSEWDIYDIVFHPKHPLAKRFQPQDTINFRIKNYPEIFTVNTQLFNFNDMFRISSDFQNSFGVKNEKGFAPYGKNNLPTFNLEFNSEYLEALMAVEQQETIFTKIVDNIDLTNRVNFQLDKNTIALYTKFVTSSSNLNSPLINQKTLGTINSENVDEFIQQYNINGKLGTWFYDQIDGLFKQPNWVTYYNDSNKQIFDYQGTSYNLLNNLDQFSFSTVKYLFQEPNAKISLELIDKETGESIIKSIFVKDILKANLTSANKGILWDKNNKELKVEIPTGWYDKHQSDKKFLDIVIKNLQFSNVTNVPSQLNFNAQKNSIPFDIPQNVKNNPEVLISNEIQMSEGEAANINSVLTNEKAIGVSWKVNVNNEISNAVDLGESKPFVPGTLINPSKPAIEYVQSQMYTPQKYNSSLNSPELDSYELTQYVSFIHLSDLTIKDFKASFEQNNQPINLNIDFNPTDGLNVNIDFDFEHDYLLLIGSSVHKNISWDLTSSTTFLSGIQNWMKSYKEEFFKISGYTDNDVNFEFNYSIRLPKLTEDGFWMTSIYLSELGVDFSEPVITFK